MYLAPHMPVEEAGVEWVGWGGCGFVLEEAVTSFGGPCRPCQIRGQEMGVMGVIDGLSFPRSLLP